MLKVILATATVLLLSRALPARADLASGLEAAAAQRWTDALRAFRPLAERGDTNAQVNLGNLYMRGLGVKQDYHAAHRWYGQAARQGNVAGQSKLGIMYYYGLGVEENPAEAVQWFLKAAERGDPESALVLGMLYDQGDDGVPRQPAEAYLWYSIAADLGKQDAEVPRLKLLEELSPAVTTATLTRLNAWRERHGELLPKPQGGHRATETAPSTAGQALPDRKSRSSGHGQHGKGAAHSPK